MRPRLLTPGEVARRMGVSVSTLRRWEDRGLIDAHRTAGRHRRYEAGEVDALADWIADQTDKEPAT